MKKKGFTLVELLAVIVILSIILLIAVPAVKKTVDSAKKKSAENDAVMIKNIAEKYYTSSLSENEEITGVDLTTDVLSYSGEKPSKGYLHFTEDGIAYGKMYINGYCIEVKSDGTNISEKAIESDCDITNISTGDNTGDNTGGNTGGNQGGSESTDTTKTYTNGEVVYFDVKNGVKCSGSDYHVDNSKTGYNGINTTTSNQNGCLKFYTFNDTGSTKINLLLDHNTTAKVEWGNVSNGPIKVLAQLKIDTDEWKGTLTPENYALDQTGQKSNAKYTIDYSGYKARLITAQEIATISGKTSWDEKTTNLNLYFDSKNGLESSTCKKGNTSGCKYGWLYDRTATDCTTYGCLNNSDSTVNGYWTSSLDASSSFYTYAWWVRSYAAMTNYNVSLAYPGFRPVIEVDKSILK